MSMKASAEREARQARSSHVNAERDSSGTAFEPASRTSAQPTARPWSQLMPWGTPAFHHDFTKKW